MRHLVVGTAGHIDHGKSTLVRLLTGIDPDRLKEEKLRGITIDLGFADLDLGEGRILSFVDVPGHERFVRHMVAGASGIDAVLLVVAADEGIRPQTREHVTVCDLLGIRHGIVAVTKADLVDGELLEVVALEVRDFLTGTFLEEPLVVAFSSKTGAGRESLLDALRGLFDRVPRRAHSGVPRLPVDRSFVQHGFGTVVTGTLVTGSLAEGEEVEVLPGALRGRIRGLQVHRTKVARAEAGSRVAANLQGLACDDAPRGATLTRPGALMTTRRLHARLRLLPETVPTLRRGGRVRFHQGTCEREARIVPLDWSGDGDARAEIVLSDDTVLLPGDRFILRRPSPVDTVGGGEVLDIRPPRRRSRMPIDERAVDEGPAGALLLRLARAGDGGRERGSLASELGLSPRDLDTLAEGPVSRGKIVPAGGSWFDASVWSSLEERARQTLAEFHAREPLRPGMAREELRVRAGGAMPPDAWRGLLEGLAQRDLVRLEGERVALADHRVVLSPTDLEVRDRIAERFRRAGLDPPSVAEAVSGEDPEKAARLLDLLLAEGRLVRIRDGRLFDAGALERLRGKLREYGRTSRTIDVSAFKELAGVTRKNAIPLLEQLDAERSTRRLGNMREILIG